MAFFNGKGLHVGALAGLQADVHFVGETQLGSSFLHLRDAGFIRFAGHHVAIHEHVASVGDDERTHVAA